MTNTVGVIDCLSSFQVGGPMASADGATSGIAHETLENWLRDIIIENQPPSGVRVNSRNAMQFPPVFYAISKIAGHVAMMSASLKEKLAPRQTRDADEHNAARLLREPHELYAGSVFVETVSGHAAFRGNGRAFIERDRFMKPLRLLIMPPDCTKTILVNGQKWHFAELVIDTETQATRKYAIPDRDCLHIMGHSGDGIVGYDVLELAKRSISLGLSAEYNQAHHMGRKSMPGMVLEVPKGELRKEGEAAKVLRDFREAHEGLDNIGKTAMLRHGITLAKGLSHTASDSQLNETRQFQREDAALWWALETILGEDGNSYNSEEQRTLAYLKGLPGKLKKRWEEERDRKLLSEREKESGRFFHKLNAGGLLRADMKTTLETLEVGRRAEIWSSNDCREILDENAVEGGDEYRNPNTTSGNTVTIGNSTVAAEATERFRARLVDAYTRRLASVFQVEANRIRDAAAKQTGEKFNAWLENFYGSANFPKTLARVLEELDAEDSSGQANVILLQHALDLGKAISEGTDLEIVLKAWAEEPAAIAEALVEGGR